MALRGIGLGLSNMPATTAGLNAISDNLVAQGAAINNVMRRLSASLVIVMISIFYEVRRAQLFAQGRSVEAGSLQAVNEVFIILALVVLLMMPIALKLNKQTNQ